MERVSLVLAIKHLNIQLMKIMNAITKILIEMHITEVESLQDCV